MENIANRLALLANFMLCWLFAGFLLAFCWLFAGFLLAFCWLFAGFYYF